MMGGLISETGYYAGVDLVCFAVRCFDWVGGCVVADCAYLWVVLVVVEEVGGVVFFGFGLRLLGRMLDVIHFANIHLLISIG